MSGYNTVASMVEICNLLGLFRSKPARDLSPLEKKLHTDPLTLDYDIHTHTHTYTRERERGERELTML